MSVCLFGDESPTAAGRFVVGVRRAVDPPPEAETVSDAFFGVADAGQALVCLSIFKLKFENWKWLPVRPFRKNSESGCVIIITDASVFTSPSGIANLLLEARGYFQSHGWRGLNPTYAMRSIRGEGRTYLIYRDLELIGGLGGAAGGNVGMGVLGRMNWVYAIFIALTICAAWILLSKAMQRRRCLHFLEERKIMWEKAAVNVRDGVGFFIVDYVYAHSKGIADFAVWYCPFKHDKTKSTGQLVASSGFLTSPPKEFRNMDRLIEEFGNDAVRENLEITMTDHFE